MLAGGQRPAQLKLSTLAAWRISNADTLTEDNDIPTRLALLGGGQAIVPERPWPEANGGRGGRPIGSWLGWRRRR